MPKEAIEGVRKIQLAQDRWNEHTCYRSESFTETIGTETIPIALAANIVAQ